jgi:hypothetical protein
VDSDGGWCPSSHQRNHWVVLREETNEQFSHQRRHATLFAKDGEKLKFGQLARPPSMRFAWKNLGGGAHLFQSLVEAGCDGDGWTMMN